MKKGFSLMTAVLVLSLCSVSSLYSQNSDNEITIPEIPDTIEDFVAVRDQLAGSPEGGAAVFVLAAYLYTVDPDLGIDAITVALDRSMLTQASDGYKGYAPGYSVQNYLKSYLWSKPYIIRSYFAGTTPENGYTIPGGSPVVRVTRNSYSVQNDTRIKVFVECSGADSPRPVALQQNNRGLWKAVNVNSLFVGIRPPVEVMDDNL